MREIRFRGKRIDIGRWVEGSYLKMFHGLHMDGNHYIHFIVDTKGIRYEVYPETIGQYTGLHDRNGREIYEGDVLFHRWNSGYDMQEETISEVKWRKGAFIVDDKKRSDWLLSIHASAERWASVEVIGNAWEDGDLLNDREGAKTDQVY